MRFYQRMLADTASNAFGIAITAGIQIITVPILSTAWGVNEYGRWLLLSTIPSYFALTDLGFGAATQSSISMQMAQGDSKGALRTFQTSWLFIVAMTVIFVILTVALLILPVPHLLAKYQPTGDLLYVSFILILYAAFAVIGRYVLVILLSTGHYAYGTLVYSLGILVEAAGMLIFVWMGGGPIGAAIMLLLGRVALFTLVYIVTRVRISWFALGFGAFSQTEFKRLLSPALAAMAIPVALSLNLQGVTLVVGATLGATAVASLIPVRTASRIVIQIVGTLNRASMPAQSASIATGDRGALSKIQRANVMMIVGVLLPGAAIFALWGSDIVRIWTKGVIVPDTMFVELMGLAMFLHGVWYFGVNLLVAANAHVRVSSWLVFFSIAAIGAVFGGSLLLGLRGAALAVVAAELCCALVIGAGLWRMRDWTART